MLGVLGILWQSIADGLMSEIYSLGFPSLVSLSTQKIAAGSTSRAVHFQLMIWWVLCLREGAASIMAYSVGGINCEFATV